MNRRQMFGSVAAIAAGSLLLGTNVLADDKDKKKAATVKCAGANACKGQGECNAADGSHSCKGKNDCKGKGWVNVADSKACKDAKGTVVKESKKKA